MGSIDKRDFISKISKKLNRNVEIPHINSIINILCDLLLSSLKNDEEFKIHNLGTFLFKKKRSKKYFDVLEQKMKLSEGNNLIKFKINRKLKKKIIDNLKVDQ